MTGASHHPYEDDVGAYLLGALSDDEARAFERHLECCERCRVECSRLRLAAKALPRSVEPMAPPAGLKPRLMRAVELDRKELTEPRRGRIRLGLEISRMRLGTAAAAAAVILALGGVAGWAITRSARGPAVRTVAAAVDGRRLPGTEASFVVEPAASGGLLRLTHLPPPGHGRVYELWVDRHGAMVPAAVFGAAPDGSGTAAISSSLRGVSAILVTSEAAPGALRPTMAPLVRARL